MQMTLEECLAHIPNRLTPEMERFADDSTFLDCRFIFTTRAGRQQHGYCTHCKSDFETSGYRHNSKQVCPVCGSKCIVKSASMGRGGLVFHRRFTYYMKSAIDPNAIVAVNTYARRDYSGDYRNFEAQYAARSLYVFVFGKGSAAFHHSNYWETGQAEWEKSLRVTSHVRAGLFQSTPWDLSATSIAEAVRGTPYQYSMWTEFCESNFLDMVGFFDFFTRYPGVEYFVKAGFTKLVKEKLFGLPTYRTINWRAKTLPKALKLSKEDLREIRRRGIGLTYRALKFLGDARKSGLKLSAVEAVSLANDYEYDLDAFMTEASGHGGIRHLHNYLTKQYECNMSCGANPGPYHSVGAVFHAWRDYLADCKKLQLDITQDSIVFPRNLYEAHQHTIDQIRYEADKALTEKIRERLTKLKGLCFKYHGLLIRPAESSQEIVAEGRALNHCVGRYAPDHASGKTTILFVRHVSEPDKPFYTVEVYQGRVTQCYGFENKAKSPEEKAEVDAFMSAFKRARLARHQIQNQEVAS